MSATAEADLKRELDELRDRNHTLHDDELFVVWFLLATVTDRESDAVEALTGTSRDKDVDAVYIDDDAQAVFVVQGKHRSNHKKRESRPDVMSFAGLPAELYASDNDYEVFARDLDPNTDQKLRTARSRLLRREYRLQCYYVTTGACTDTNIRDAQKKARQVRKARLKPALDVFAWTRVVALLNNYLAGAAPPIPLLSLPISRDALHQFDSESEIESWVTSMNGRDVAAMFEAAGERLFARNIRGYLGAGAVNDEIRGTLDKAPGQFWYLNNGITLVCDSADRQEARGETTLTVTQPQVINGQQTTRTIAEVGRKAAKARVAVRVISIPRDSLPGQRAYDEMVEKIVQATNWQNAITSADLHANDRRQIELERELGRQGYFYVRKRASTREIGRRRPRGAVQISKEDLMRAGAACRWPNMPLKKGIQPLFRDDYDAIFRQRTERLLSSHWLFRAFSKAAWGTPVRQYSKFIATYLIWQDVDDSLGRSKTRHRRFVDICRGVEDDQELQIVIERLFVAMERFYRAKRGRGADAAEPAAFFKRKDVFDDFEQFWTRERPKLLGDYRASVSKLITRVETA